MARWWWPPSTSAYGAEVEPGQIEEGDRVAVAEVEEEVGRAAVVAVLEHLDQREAEHAVVELHRPLDVAADERHVVHAARGAGRALIAGQQVLRPSARSRRSSSAARWRRMRRLRRRSCRLPDQQLGAVGRGGERAGVDVGEATGIAGRQLARPTTACRRRARRTRARGRRAGTSTDSPACSRAPHSTASRWWMRDGTGVALARGDRHQAAGGRARR